MHILQKIKIADKMIVNHSYYIKQDQTINRFFDNA